MKFEKGDRVKIVKIDLGENPPPILLKDYETRYKGKEGKIEKIIEGERFPYRIKFGMILGAFNDNELIGLDKQLRIE